jgi:hypothetical protein
VTFVESLAVDTKPESLETLRGRLVKLGGKLGSNNIVVVIIMVDSEEGVVSNFVHGSVDGVVIDGFW